MRGEEEEREEEEVPRNMGVQLSRHWEREDSRFTDRAGGGGELAM